MSDELEKIFLNQNEKWMFAVGASRLCERVRNFLLNIEIFCALACLFYISYILCEFITTHKKIPLIYCFSVEEIPVAGRVFVFFFVCCIPWHCCRRCWFWSLCEPHIFHILFLFRTFWFQSTNRTKKSIEAPTHVIITKLSDVYIHRMTTMRGPIDLSDYCETKCAAQIGRIVDHNNRYSLSP